MNELSSKYGSEVNLEYRKSFGQFFTNPSIARFMSQWVLEKGANRIYDPAFGLGAFYDAAIQISEELDFYGSELDGSILIFLNERSQILDKIKIDQQDYLLNWNERHENIICNPPYMRFQLFENRADVFSAFEKHLGLRVSGYTNIASAFLLKSLSELQEGGRLAYIMPLEFLNTGYGKLVKKMLLRNNALKTIIRIDCEKEAFSNVITSVGIILVENNGIDNNVNFHVLEDLNDLQDILKNRPKASLACSGLNPADKWLKYFEDGKIEFNSRNLIKLEQYGSFSRGIATGANEFFALSMSRARELGLPESALKSCITKSNQVKSSIIRKNDIKSLITADLPVLVLDFKEPMDASLKRYILYGERMGYNQRYLTKTRNPWFKLEHRTPAPLLFGVFSRNGFKAIRNLSEAINLTCFHGFYPNLFGQGIIDYLFLYFNSKVAREILRINMRKYGDNLGKFEPNDLNTALVPSYDWFMNLGSDLIARSLKFIEKNGFIPDELESKFNSLLS